MSEVYYIDHPLIKHKITMLRDKRTGTYEFRKLVEEIAMLMGYEALSDMKTKDVKIKTPIEETVQPVLDGRKPAIIPILRAGLGMVNGLLSLIPTAKVGHIGMKRNETTHVPEAYYCNFPPHKAFQADDLSHFYDQLLHSVGSNPHASVTAFTPASVVPAACTDSAAISTCIL